MKNSTNREALKNTNGVVNDSGFIPKFKTPSVGGSYFKKADDSSPPVLAERTGHELTTQEKTDLDAEKGDAKPKSSK